MNITVISQGHTSVYTREGEVSLYQLLAEEGYSFHTPCGGQKRCLKCRVQVSGGCVPPDSREAELLSGEPEGTRYACMVRLVDDATVTLMHQPITVTTKWQMPDFTPKPMSGEYGVAIDIGTTTLAAYLYELPACCLLETRSAANPQGVFGADVISRIEHALSGKGEDLASSIRKGLNQLLHSFACPIEKIGSVVITGNTAMLYLLCNYDPACIAAAPFIPDAEFGGWFTPEELGLDCPNARIYLPAIISAYVGADIICAILAADMTAKKENSLLVDIGTNGEMALCTDGKLITCSTAAGPAFEGSGLTMGVSAVAGAISSVSHENGVIHFTTIDNEKPIGICGSGILDALATFLELGLIEDTGRFDPDSEYAHYLIEYQGETAFRFPNTDIVITQKDISAIQLAKSAVRAGLETLLASQGLKAEDVKCLYLAGGFGSYMSLSSAGRIGLIPPTLTHKAVSLGNAAGAGAAMLVQNTTFVRKSLSLAQNAQSLTLSGNPQFSELFMEHMMFPY